MKPPPNPPIPVATPAPPEPPEEELHPLARWIENRLGSFRDKLLAHLKFCFLLFLAIWLTIFMAILATNAIRGNWKWPPF